MIKSKKQMLIVISVFTLVMILGSISFSWFNYRSETSVQQLIAGNIYLKLIEGNGKIEMSNTFPESPEMARERNDNYMTFSIVGKNSSNKILYYEFVLNHGDDMDSPKIRYNDDDLRFDLVELDSNGNEIKYLLDNVGFNSLVNKRIYVDTIEANTSNEVARYYKLRMWLNEGFIISDTNNNHNYTTEEFKNGYATVNLSVVGDFNEKEIDNAYTMIRDNAVNDPTINFANISSDSNGKGLYILPGTESDKYPINYYRGDVNNNNVIFGGFCWQIVRTTDTGGIKMIYNGKVTGNGTTCENTLHDDRIISSSIINYQGTTSNSAMNSVSDFGYMSNQRYISYQKTPTNGVYFGNDIEYGDFDNNGINEYRLLNNGNDSVSMTLDANHHYTCNQDTLTGVCTEVYYYFSNNNQVYMYVSLTDGEKIEDALYKMTGNGNIETKERNNGYLLNQNDSTIKSVVDEWFETNLTNEKDSTKTDYRPYLEDTIFCSDRSFQTVGNNLFINSGWNPYGGILTNNIMFGAANRAYNNWHSTTNVPSLTCPNETDRFMVSSSIAHLKYPVGLLTADEIVLAGASGEELIENNKYYLYTGGTYWSMSPYIFHNFASGSYAVDSSGYLDFYFINSSFGVRPVISLKRGINFVEDGNGTSTNPYVVKYN